MRVLVTGATGFIGRPLVMRLLRDGHSVRALARRPERARAQLGAEPEIVASADLRQAVAGCDAVFHLAGENLFGQRWTPSYKQRLVDSRVGLTRDLVDAMRSEAANVGTLISASAIGYYGDRGATPVDEAGERGTDFLAELCEQWEQAALEANSIGARVVIPRLGIVLGRGGGALEKMRLPFELGLGARLGSGRQMVSWIHIDDAVEMLVRALEDDTWSGPINLVAPEPCDNRTLTRALAKRLSRPALLAVPRFALRLAFGESADALLAGAVVVPRAANDHGFTYAFDSLNAALDDLVLPPSTVEITPAQALPSSPYLETHNAKHRLLARDRVDAPVEEVAAFFEQPANLALMTPSSVRLETNGLENVRMEASAIFEHRIFIGPLPMNWRSQIESWQPGAGFTDVQLRGPYESWHHQHRFIDEGDGTIVEDEVHYAVPFGPLGAIAHRLFVRPMLEKIFAYRSMALRWRFGSPSKSRKAAA